MKLSDVIIIKELIRIKMHKEIQGLRTSSEDYPSLRKVDPFVINEIMEKIKSEL